MKHLIAFLMLIISVHSEASDTLFFAERLGNSFHLYKSESNVWYRDSTQTTVITKTCLDTLECLPYNDEALVQRIPIAHRSLLRGFTPGTELLDLMSDGSRKQIFVFQKAFFVPLKRLRYDTTFAVELVNENDKLVYHSSIVETKESNESAFFIFSIIALLAFLAGCYYCGYKSEWHMKEYDAILIGIVLGVFTRVLFSTDMLLPPSQGFSSGASATIAGILITCIPGCLASGWKEVRIFGFICACIALALPYLVNIFEGGKLEWMSAYTIVACAVPCAITYILGKQHGIKARARILMPKTQLS